MNRFKVSILAATGLLILAFVLTAIGPKRVMAALGFTPVREVNSPGRQPFAVRLVVQSNSTFTVPAGKRLVITTVSAATVGTDTFIGINTAVNGVTSDLFIPYTSKGGDSFVNLAGEALAHADPGTTITVSQFGPDVAIAAVHGYYVDVP